jgi:hypothetical protein
MDAHVLPSVDAAREWFNKMLERNLAKILVKNNREKYWQKNNYTSFIIFNNIKLIKSKIIMFSLSKIHLLKLYRSILSNTPKNSEAELLHPKILEQRGVEQSYAKHV